MKPTPEMIEAALHARVPGGAEVWAWLPQKDAWTPHETARDVMQAALSAALSVQPPAAVVGEPVAWRCKMGDQYWHYFTKEPRHKEPGEVWEPLYAAPSAPDGCHPDDLAVDRFAAEMKAKLAKKRGGGWGGWENSDECPVEYLSLLLREHVEKGDPVDVGNLAMMLHQRGERIEEIGLAESASVSQLHAIVGAWEALPGGRQVRNSDVEAWLAKDMAPAINAIRVFLRRPLPAPPALGGAK